MSLIRSRNTKPELAMARLLRRARVGYRRNVRSLPGCPDFVIRKSRIILFVDGVFWHGRNFGRLAPKLKPFWLRKITANRRRDRAVTRRLRGMGWKVIRIWEDDLEKNPGKCLGRVLRAASERAPILGGKRACLPHPGHAPGSTDQV